MKQFFELETWLVKNKIKAVSKDDFYLTINKKDIRFKYFFEIQRAFKAPKVKNAEIVVSNKMILLKQLICLDDLKVNFLKFITLSII